YDDYNNEYLDVSCRLIQNNFTLNHLGKYAVKRHALIDSSYKTDPYRYNSYEDFKYALTEENKDEVSLTKSSFVLRIRYPGIFPFIEMQREWVVDQLKGWDKTCSIEDKGLYNLSVFPNPSSDYINISNETGGFEFAQFILYDFTGKQIVKTDYQLMESSYYTLQLATPPPGIYLLLKKSASGKIGRAKVVIQ
ncbi:MAG TPA: T9SS type A sorting domain-containing protein, partial [Bacteroidia bacterium]|nr:T9SS type A sorting domain-containing protein [Bacteroidia bacterium]